MWISSVGWKIPSRASSVKLLLLSHSLGVSKQRFQFPFDVSLCEGRVSTRLRSARHKLGKALLEKLMLLAPQYAGVR